MPVPNESSPMNQTTADNMNLARLRNNVNTRKATKAVVCLISRSECKKNRGGVVMDTDAESLDKSYTMTNWRRTLRLMLGSLVFVFLLEAIFMVGIIVALVTVSFFMFTLLFPLHPDQNVVLTFSLSYIVFLAIATPAMLGWRRLVTNKEERIMSFALVLSFLSIAFPFIPLAWNLYYFEFLLSTVVSTWPVITLTGALLLVLSF
ncbi:MAG: hypothetical protein ACXABY_06205, partial [Candidatus Thorarchaeota archaeon]